MALAQPACDPPLRLDDFYGLRNAVAPNGMRYRVRDLQINGQYLLGILETNVPHPPVPPEPRYFMYVQDLGPDLKLDLNDAPPVFLGAWATYPYMASISPFGMVTFQVQDPQTAWRVDPNGIDPSTGLPAPQPIPPDVVMVACFFTDCWGSMQEVKRIRPITTQTPQLSYDYEGRILSVAWSETSLNLIYTYVQQDNIHPPNSYPRQTGVLPPVYKHTAVETFFPFSGTSPSQLFFHDSNVLGGADQVYVTSLATRSDGREVLNMHHWTVASSTIQVNNQWHLVTDPANGPFGPHQLVGMTGAGTGEFPNRGQLANTPNRGGSRIVQSTANPDELLNVYANWETGLSPNILIRDLFFTGSTDQHAQSHAILPVNDRRDVNSVYFMGDSRGTFAVETMAQTNWNDLRTEIYRYQPSSNPGQAGQYVLYKTVTDLAGSNRFRLSNASGKNVVGRLEGTTADMSIIHCP